MLNPTDTIPVSMDAASWDRVLMILAKQLVAPYELTAPLIQGIQQQCIAFGEQKKEPHLSQGTNMHRPREYLHEPKAAE
jgi:hypothetical protein